MVDVLAGLCTTPATLDQPHKVGGMGSCSPTESPMNGDGPGLGAKDGGSKRGAQEGSGLPCRESLGYPVDRQGRFYRMTKVSKTISEPSSVIHFSVAVTVCDSSSTVTTRNPGIMSRLWIFFVGKTVVSDLSTSFGL